MFPESSMFRMPIMKAFQLTIICLGMLLGLAGGCQHRASPTMEMEKKFFSTLRAVPDSERAIRSAHYFKLSGRYDLALQELSTAAENDPANTRLLNVLGSCYDFLGDYAKAQSLYEKALSLDPDNLSAMNNLGYSNYLSGNYKAAEKHFRMVLDRDPNYLLARNNLGLLWCRQGRDDQALALWRKTEGEAPAREKLNQVLAGLGRPTSGPHSPVAPRASSIASLSKDPNLPPERAGDPNRLQPQEPKNTTSRSKNNSSLTLNSDSESSQGEKARPVMAGPPPTKKGGYPKPGPVEKAELVSPAAESEEPPGHEGNSFSALESIELASYGEIVQESANRSEQQRPSPALRALPLCRAVDAATEETMAPISTRKPKTLENPFIDTTSNDDSPRIAKQQYDVGKPKMKKTRPCRFSTRRPSKWLQGYLLLVHDPKKMLGAREREIVVY